METSRSKPNYWKGAFIILVGSSFLIMLLFPIFARSRRAAQHSQYAGGTAGMDQRASEYLPASPAMVTGKPAESPVSWGAAYAASAQRMVISTAEMRLEVGDVQKTHDQIGQIATGAGGFITESSLSHGDGVETGNVTVRVPAKQYQPTLARIAKLGKVLEKQESGQDVTEEYVDLEARIRNLKREEQAFLAVLNKASKVPDILAVENELGRVRGQIEQATGRIQYLQNQVALATITVRLSEPTPVVAKIVNWDVFLTARGAANALQVVFRKLVSVVIWGVVFIPFWALIGLVVYGSKRYRARRKP